MKKTLIFYTIFVGVTAIIGAISIGVGIDYSIHMTQRFREELRKQDTKFNSIRVAARGTGMALLGSAASSVVGFAIMGFDRETRLHRIGD